MSFIRFFDANIRLGPRLEIMDGSLRNQQRLDGKKVTVDTVLMEMKENNIAKALVYHVMSYQYNAAYGNKRLINEISGCENLLPLFMLYPAHTGEIGGIDNIYKILGESRIKGVLSYSGSYCYMSGGNFIAEEWNMGDIYEMLESMQMPVFSRVEADLEYDGVYRLLKNHPRLRLVLRDVGLSDKRNLFGLVRQCDNLYVETTSYKAFFGIEDFVGKFGSERLVFGSGYPVQNMGGAITSILLAEIKPEDKENISWKNLDRLMGDIKYEGRKQI